VSRVERSNKPHDNTPHDEANCPHCQEDIAAMTPSAGPAEVRRYTPYVETVTHSDGVSNDSIWDEPRARMRPWMHGEWVLASDYDTLAARCASQARELAELRVPVERDKYLCRLLVEWYVRVNDGEDHAAPAEHILRGLVRYADERQQAVAERDARIAELERDLKIQNAVNDLAYRPHQLLVESRDGWQRKADAAEQSLAAMRERFNGAVSLLRDAEYGGHEWRAQRDAFLAKEPT
jgi:hypothetical protein